jgi:uncharacterized protein YbjT (DUF2867 family)
MKTVCVLGGTGFVGSSIVRQLSEAGYLVKVFTRNCQKGKHLASLANVQVIECNIFNEAALKQSLKSAVAVINLVGILHENRKLSFQSIHAELPKKLAEVCIALGIPRLLHMSALKASDNAPSQYLKSKAQGEAYLARYADQLNITVFKPSVIFGPCDSFINLFAKLIRLLPVILLAKPKAKFQPVYVQDVASAFVKAIDKKSTFGKVYELAGPKIYTLEELIKLVAKALNKPRLVIGLNDSLSYLQASLMELLPVKLMTRDNLSSMQVDSVSNQSFPDYLDSQPSALESILPSYINA